MLFKPTKLLKNVLYKSWKQASCVTCLQEWSDLYCNLQISLDLPKIDLTNIDLYEIDLHILFRVM